MLIQSHTGEIVLLPALPSSWKNGEVKGLCARGGFEVNMKWKNGRATSFEILSNRGGNCRIKFPNIENSEINDEAGNRIAYVKESSGIIKFSTKKASNYYISIDE